MVWLNFISERNFFMGSKDAAAAGNSYRENGSFKG